jgi:hypothetical protein
MNVNLQDLIPEGVHFDLQEEPVSLLITGSV